LVKPAERWKKRWAEKAMAAAADYREGVLAPERNPIEEAIKKTAKYYAALEAAKAAKRWETNLGKVTLTEWQEKASTIGADRYPGGIDANRDKQAKFVDKFRPLLEGAQSAVLAMPDVTPADRDRRAIEMIHRLRELKGKWR